MFTCKGTLSRSNRELNRSLHDACYQTIIYSRSTYYENFPGISPVIDQVGVEEGITRLQARSIKHQSKVFALKLALSMIDLTTLSIAEGPELY